MPEITNLYLVEEREKAIKVKQGDLEVWLPRSQIKYLRKYAKEPDGRQEMVVDIPDWLADEKGLD